MRTYRLFTAILAIIVIACLSGVHGQDSTPASIVSPNETLQYTQHYTMPTVSVPSTHISVPAKTAIVGKRPATLYPNNINVPSLWISGWTEYAVVPQGATVSLIAVSPIGGNGYLGETLNGATYNSNFYFYPNSVLYFYADTIGRHTLSVSINGRSSNQVVIDVVTQYNNYPGYYPEYYRGYYPWDYYYYWNYHPRDYWGLGYYPGY